MRNQPKYQLEQATFIAAVDGLKRHRDNGYDASGLDALLVVDYQRRPALHRLSERDLTPEDLQYFRKMGAYVELALELPSPGADDLDQQG